MNAHLNVDIIFNKTRVMKNDIKTIMSQLDYPSQPSIQYFLER